MNLFNNVGLIDKGSKTTIKKLEAMAIKAGYYFSFKNVDIFIKDNKIYIEGINKYMDCSIITSKIWKEFKQHLVDMHDVNIDFNEQTIKAYQEELGNLKWYNYVSRLSYIRSIKRLTEKNKSLTKKLKDGVDLEECYCWMLNNNKIK